MTVLAALATAVRERLAAGHEAPLPGFGTLSRQHIAARVQARADGSRVLLPPSETVRFSQDATDPSAVAAALARTQGVDAASAATALRDAVDQLEAIVVATGEARLPGVGLFRRTSSTVLFAADTTLLTEINRRYAGLMPVEAAPAPVEAPDSPRPASIESASPEPVVEPEEPTQTTPATPVTRDVSVTDLRAGFAATVAPVGPDRLTPETLAENLPTADGSAPQDALSVDGTQEAPSGPDVGTPTPDAEPVPLAEWEPAQTLPLTPPPAVPAADLDAWDAPAAPEPPTASEPERAEPEQTAGTLPDAESTDVAEDEATPAAIGWSETTPDTEKPEIGTVHAGVSEPDMTPPDASEADPYGADSLPTPDADGSEPGSTDVDEPPVEPEETAPHAAPETPRPRRRRRRRRDTAAPDPLGSFLATTLPLGAPGSRRRGLDESEPAAPTGAAQTNAAPTPATTPAPESAPGSASLPTADSTSEPGEPPAPDQDATVSAPEASPPDADGESWPVSEVDGLPVFEAPAPRAAWSTDADTAMPAVDLSLGEDLDDEDLDGFADVDHLAAAPTDTSQTPRSSVLDDIYGSEDGPLGDLGAASAAATALGLGLDTDFHATRPAPNLSAQPAPAIVPPPVVPPGTVHTADATDTWFSMGSLLLLAVSLAAIGAAATWPRFAGTPPTPGPSPGGGAFGDTLGDAAEAALRERGLIAPDSTRLTAAPDSAAPARTAPVPAEAAPVSAPETDYESVEITPDAAPEPTSAPTAAARRTLGVAPPSGTAILPPRVAGLAQPQTRALASRDGLARGDGFTWVVLSSPGRDEAQTLAQRYSQSGYRAGVVATTAAGRTTYRVGVGQYGSRDDAQSLRNRLPPQAPADTWLLDLSSSGLSF